MAGIGVSYTPGGGGGPYSILFENFTDDALPRQYSNDATFSFSANGASIISGPSYNQKRIWAISAVLPTNDAETFDELFRSWDSDRSEGLAAAVGIIDETFGDSISTSAVFSTAPTYSRFGPVSMLVSFGLTEV